MAAHFIQFLLLSVVLVLSACTPRQNTGNQPNRTNLAQTTKRPIQLQPFTPPTPIPTAAPPQNTPSPPPPLCSVDRGVQYIPGCRCDAYIVTCQNNRCTDVKNGDTLKQNYPPKSGCYDNSGQWGSLPDGRMISNTPDYWCTRGDITPGGTGTWCLEKPVVYLYPTTPTLVDVWVETVGDVVVSDPHYPFGGWQDVLAHPDGTLEYQGKTYVELFYESEVTTVITPKSGISIATSHLKPTLTLLTTQLGLSPTEQAEFLDFWVPRLTGLGQPYIMFSVIETFEKLRIDQVHLSPEPDTRIEFLAYFKPLATPYTGPVLQLPPRPERVGFTMVEWGGTIDSQSDANGFPLLATLAPFIIH